MHNIVCNETLYASIPLYFYQLPSDSESRSSNEIILLTSALVPLFAVKVLHSHTPKLHSNLTAIHCYRLIREVNYIFL